MKYQTCHFLISDCIKNMCEDMEDELDMKSYELVESVSRTKKGK